MSESKLRYLCDGFYPVEADNVVHAGLLFALQIARQKYGPMARCNRLDLRSGIAPEGATFEAAAGVPPSSESYQFTVLVDRQPSKISPFAPRSLGSQSNIGRESY